MSPRPSSYADALRGLRGEPAAVADTLGAAHARGPRLLLRPLLRYVPVVLGCGILWHLFVFGLEPAWSEHRRLSAAHEAIAADNAELRAMHSDLQLAQAAHEDPHYQERRRRWRAERLAARARLPEQKESRPADLAELARRLAAAAGTTLPGEQAGSSGAEAALESVPQAVEAAAEPMAPAPGAPAAEGTALPAKTAAPTSSAPTLTPAPSGVR